jgi:tRNA pseudouridine13 synthase
MSSPAPDLAPRARPLLTADIPAAGGLFKATPEDFEVEELPAYVPEGSGEHLFLWVEKRGRDTPEVVRALSSALKLDEREIGVAGMKDRQAVTRQFLSIPARLEAQVAAFALEGVQILSAVRHGNKLKTGHLKGNRFRLTLHDVRDVGALRASLERLEAVGLPNAFGSQRFGRGGSNALAGLMLLRGERLPRAPSRFQRKLYLSALQSELYNRALAARLRAGTLDRALPGDVLRKEDTGGLFLCEDAAVDQERVRRFEVSPTGPIFGPRMNAPAGEVAALEAGLLEEVGIRPEEFSRGRGETEGARRPYRVRLAELTVEDRGGGRVQLGFQLPSGAYATEVLRELLEEVPEQV